ncbi:MAG: peptidase S41, partial [Cytophagaceae bacterium]
SVTGDVAYLRPGQFLNADATGGTSSHQTFDKGEFFHFVDSAFALMHARKAKHLVLDLRGNPGGDNSFSDHLLAYFATRPFSFNSSFTVKTSPVTKRFWQGVNEPALAALKANILTRKDGQVFPVETPLQLPRTDSLRFTGDVYALIDRYTYSNATTVAAQIQDYRFGQLVGEQTAESPTLYAAVHEFELPRTKIGVTYPKAFMVRPNGDKSLKGVVPNFPIADDIGTPADEILAWTLGYIRRSDK